MARMINVWIPVVIRNRAVRVARDARWIAAIASVAAAAVGFGWGTYVAGGSDSYCYLSQAELFATGHIVNLQPIAAIAPWAQGANAFVPTGHVPAFSPAGATVPMCPPGYPMLMALARTVGGRAVMFAVVPLLGALAVWSTFVLGRRVAGPAAGALAALLLAASPPFLYQVVQPMTDVPASAMWAVALVAVTDRRFALSARGAALGGIATGAALLIRPNLVPVAAVAALAVFIEPPLRWRDVLRTWTMFGAGILPFALIVAALQNAMYGGPLKSGYGDLDFLFRIDHVWPNLQRYPTWLLQTETPIVLCALASPWLASSPGSRRQRLWLLGFIAAVFACYIPYEVFNAWWYLRFLLPAYPPLLVLTAAAVVGLLSRVSARWRAFGLAAAAMVSIFLVRVAIDRRVFELRDLERRYRLAGDYVAAHLPPNAAVVTAHQSGSVRFYSQRLTLDWRALPPSDFARALDFLRAQGHRPYLLLETWEQPEFVERFQRTSPLGGLGWPPMVDINHQVRIYEPDDYARYRSGIPVRTDRIWTRRRDQISIFLRDKTEIQK
jgi:oligosaccharyl transferase STT3 subunit